MTDAAPLRVLHLVGSAVSEFHADLSRLYAADCLAATADPERYEVQVAHVDPDGRWRFPRELDPAALADAPSVSVAEAVARISDLGIDVMVPQLFCLPGMTTYRSLFDLLDIPYVGNPPDVMALAADKARAKAVVAGAGVSVPAGHTARPGEPSRLPLPVVVKPVDSDNSLGLTLVRDAADLDAAVSDACRHGSAALVEAYVELGREVRCGVLERNGELVCLPLEEYAVGDAAPIRDAASKLDRDPDGDLHLVAKDGVRAWMVGVDDPITERVWDAARRCHAALGCRDYSLFDFRIDPSGEPWFLEAGLYCSFARQSVVVMMAEAGGIGLRDLFHEQLIRAVGRRPTR